jgi:hypothetical protein
MRSTNLPKVAPPPEYRRQITVTADSFPTHLRRSAESKKAKKAKKAATPRPAQS